ncbi:MAG: hypothetical protein N3B11_06160 [Coriobacteriia bacterium]|nr:hypothetical protein [Coriobacteriia bacterium]
MAMARAGFCRSCGTNVWVTEDGAGTCGHPASEIEGIYEVSQAAAQAEETNEAAAAVTEDAPEVAAQAVAGEGQHATEAVQSTPEAPKRKRPLGTVAAAVGAIVLLVFGVAFATRPQLAVTRLVTEGAVEQGEPSQAVVTVTNEGKRKGSSSIVLTVDGEEVGRGEVTVEAGGSKDVTIEFTLSRDPGNYVLMARGFDVTEQVRVLVPAACEVTAVTVDPKALHAGIDESGVCVATVENTGEAEGEFDVEFSLDGTVLGSRTLTVPGGSQNEATYEFDVPGVGDHVLEANGVKAAFAVHATARPAHGTVVLNSLKGGRNRIKIINNRPSDVLVVLSQPGDGKPALLAVYLRSNGSHTVSGVKDGTYQVFYSFGSDWCPKCRRFTSDRYDGRFETTDKLSSSRSMYTQLTLTFGASSGGSPTEDVGEDQFPKM